MNGNSKMVILEIGYIFSVPENISKFCYHRSKNSEVDEGLHEKTPKIIRLNQGTRGFYFRRKTEKQGASKVLFVPKDLRGGETLRVDWVEDNCACAVPAA